MVGWFDARQLLGTAIKTVVSAMFGAYADKREIQAALSVPDKYDYSNREQIWIDYMSDTGDGFDATFTMAHLLSEEYRVVDGNETLKGDILILGGDQVYPVATRDEYKDRFRGPFDAACRNQKNYDGSREHHLYAVPGNHDWYDGLSNFIKIFCQKRTIGSWNTKQKRSYFAIKLPHNWWLWGIDIQLEADIDFPQLQYFENVGAHEMQPGDKVILCTAEPSWVFTTKRGDHTYSNLRFFEQRYIVNKGFDLVLSLAGDLHHYAHYVHCENGRQYHKVTSGGGGAFLHPTHNLKAELDLREGEFKLQKTFPSKRESEKLAFWNLLFPLFNRQFAVFMGSFYLLFAWILQEATKGNTSTFMQGVSHYPITMAGFMDFMNDIFKILLINPSVVFVIAAVILGVTFFTDSKSCKGKYIWIIGMLHGVVHIVNGFFLIWVFALLTYPLPIHLFFKILMLTAEIFIVGGLTGCLVMGAYLLLANLIFGIHDNEAFSAIKWNGYKNFLRLHITAEALSIYPIGVHKTAKWKKSGDMYTPDKEVQTKLVDEVITIRSKRYEKETESVPVLSNS